MKEVIEELYQQDIPFDGNRYWCPICVKQYKKLGWLQYHLNQQKCYKVKDLLVGTTIEKEMLDIYREIHGDGANKAMMYRDHDFNMMARFVAFSKRNRVDSFFYFAYTYARFDRYPIGKMLDIGLKNKTLKEFFEFRRSNPEWVDQDEFVKVYEERLKTDPMFLLRSFQRGDLNPETFESHFGGLNRYLNQDQLTEVNRYFDWWR